jgi:peptide/nickel transport system permease protein
MTAEISPVAVRSARRRRHWPASTVVGIGLIGLIVAAAALAPVIAPYDPNALDFGAQTLPPSWQHLMGTDQNGRDLFSRTLYGLRLDLAVVAVVTYVPMPIGIVVGTVAGYFGGKVDAVVSRVVDIVISFPFIVLIISIIAMVGPGLKGVLIGVPIVSWAIYTRLARADMLLVRELPYMEACTALGFSRTRTIFKHAIPNLVRNSLVFSTVDVMGNLLLLAGVSYLGLGAQPPTPELGSIIADGQAYMLTAWWVVTLPALVLVAFGVGVGILGDSLSDGRLSGVVE